MKKTTPEQFIAAGLQLEREFKERAVRDLARWLEANPAPKPGTVIRIPRIGGS